MTRFDTTRWSVVLRARADSTEARSALDTLCRTYRPPVLTYIRSRGHSADEAEDLAQNFFARFLEQSYHTAADPARGRFRSFLLTALKRFLINSDLEAATQKRGGGIEFSSLPDDDENGASVAKDKLTPEIAFERSWAITVVESALTHLRKEAESAGKTELFHHLQDFLIERPDDADYARVAASLNLRRNSLAVAVHRMRARLRQLVREELAETTADADELESEWQNLRVTLEYVAE